MVTGINGVAIVERAYDDDGNEIKVSYFGTDGKPTFCDEGYAGLRYEYGANGKISKNIIYNEKNKPSAIRKYEYNPDGTKKKQYNYAPNGKLQTVKVFEYTIQE